MSSTIRSFWFARVCALLALAIAMVTLSGWIFDIRRLRSWLPTGPQIALSTMLCVLLGGMGLLALRVMALSRQQQLADEQRRNARPVLICGGAMLLLLATRIWGTADTATIAPVTLTALGLTALALVLAARNRGDGIIQVIAVANCSLFYLMVLGLLMGDERLGFIRAMSLPTSSALMVLNLGVLATLPNAGLVAMLSSQHAGGRLLRRMLAPTLLLPSAVLIVGQRLLNEGWGPESGIAALEALLLTLLLAALIWRAAVRLELFDVRVFEQNSLLAAIVTASDDAIISKDLQGVITSWNPAAERLFGYSPEEVIGQKVAILFPAERLREEAEILQRVGRGEIFNDLHAPRRRRDGTLIEISVTVSPIRSRSGQIVGAAKVARDVTALRRAQTEMQRQMQDLERINKDLDDFVYVASHDLRSPLRAVSTLAQWIGQDDPNVGAETAERLRLIQSRVQRMSTLLDDILSYARAGRGNGEVGASMSAALLVADVTATLHVPQGFRIVSDASLESVIVTRMPMEAVLHNLIGNAIKHHDKGQGIVTVAVEPRGSWWRFSVTDDGPGIGQQYRESIFEMFKTLRPRDEVEGSGMGLALVRKLVTQRGGEFGVESAAGRGSVFWFDWPRP